MAKQINCPCGEVVQGQTDDELVANAEKHVQTMHPEQVGLRTREDWLAMAEDAD